MSNDFYCQYQIICFTTDTLSKEQKQIWKELHWLRQHLNTHSSSLNFLYLMMTVLSFVTRYYSSWSLFLFLIDYLWDNCSLQHPLNFLFKTWTLFLCGISNERINFPLYIFIVRKDGSFYSRILQVIDQTDKKLKIFIFIFFSINSLFLQKNFLWNDLLWLIFRMTPNLLQHDAYL